jgi:concanavalin A-like lectin/glucanase superfamily protein
MRAIFPCWRALLAETDPGFVNERRGLEGVAGSFTAHVSRGQIVQFPINQGRKLFESCPGVPFPIPQDPSDCSIPRHFSSHYIRSRRTADRNGHRASRFAPLLRLRGETAKSEGTLDEMTTIKTACFPCFLLLPFLTSPGAGATVTTSLWTQYSATVTANTGTQPELVNLGGAIHVVSQVSPGDPCSPTDPCREVPVTAYLNLAGVNGLGQTTGTRYRATGSASVQGSINIPGGFIVSAAFQLVPPDPIVPPSPINVQLFLRADSSGNVTAPASQPQGLVSWWQAEGDATDALGINNGTIQGTLGFVPGRVGQAFGPQGTGVVEVASSPTLQPPAVTVMAWVKSLGFPGVHNYVLSQGGYQCIAASYALYAQLGGLRFYIYNGSEVDSPAVTDAQVWDGNWHMVAGTYDGAMARMFVDGGEVDTGTPTTQPINYALPDHQRFYIGGYRGGCTLGFTGSIDEVRVFNPALTSAEIKDIYQSTP